MANKAQAVVLGKNYMSLLSMTRAAGEAGCDVTVIKTVKSIPGRFSPYRLSVEAHSKYVKKRLYVKSNDNDGLIKLLQATFQDSQEKVVILPTDDQTAAAIEMNKERLVAKFVYPHVGDGGSVVELMDKNRQKKLAQECGLPVARAWVAEIANGQYTIPDGIEYPVFTKPQISFVGNKHYMKRCSNQQELEAVLQSVAQQRDCPILIEEFVEIEKEYGVLGCCDGKRAVVPCLVDKVIIGEGVHKGVTMVGDVLPLDKTNPQLHEKIAEFLKKTGFVGLVDIDLYESNGVIFFNELNLRLGAFGYAAMCAGINMPKIVIETLLGRTTTDGKVSMEEAIRCVSEKVNLEDYADGYCDRRTYKNRLKMAQYRFIKSESDPKPHLFFKIEELKQGLRRLLKKRH